MKISFGFFGATYFSKRYFILNSSKMMKNQSLETYLKGTATWEPCIIKISFLSRPHPFLLYGALSPKLYLGFCMSW